MKKRPVLRSFTPLHVSIEIITIDANRAYIPVTNIFPPETEMGKKIGPNPIARDASTKQLPIMSPSANS